MMDLSDEHNDNIDLDRLERLHDNFDWFYLNYHYLKKDYKDQFIAVKDKKQIDNDKDLSKLVKRLGLENYDDGIIIEFVYDR